MRNFTNFGLFVEMEEGIDGLVHISDLSWEKKIKHPSEFCNVGDEIEVVVLELDKANRRMSLGHKQLQENPWDTFESVFEVGSTHKGTVVSIDGSNVGVALPYGVEGFCQAKHLKREDGTDIKVEESADFIVLEFNRNAKRITVSHLRTYEEPPAKKRGGSDNRKRRDDRDGSSSPATQRAVREVNERQAKTTFGDLDVLSQLKQQMEDGLPPSRLPRKRPLKKPRRPRSPPRRPPRPRRSRRPRRRRLPLRKLPLRSPRLRTLRPRSPRLTKATPTQMKRRRLDLLQYRYREKGGLSASLFRPRLFSRTTMGPEHLLITRFSSG